MPRRESSTPGLPAARNVRPMDSVLTGVRPRVTTGDAVRIAAETFDIEARAATDLGSERDRTFALLDRAGQPVAILKVSNPSEDPAVLDMEAAAALHVTAVDPGLSVALPWRAFATGAPGRPGRATIRRGCARRGGRRRGALGPPLRRPAWPQPDRRRRAERRGARRVGRDGGTARPGAARLHPPAGAAHDAVGRPARAGGRARCSTTSATRTSGRWWRGCSTSSSARVTPVWPRLRAQVAHTDLSVDNTLTDDGGFDHRDHRLRRHEPHGAGHRPGVGARLARRRPRRASSCSGSPGSSLTATSGGSSSRRSS